jgi:two-component system NtrC family sensor kinase
MAAGIAHEINNPLAVINENAGWMQDLLEEEEFRNSPNFEEYRSSLQKISTHVERARKIIFNMLSYARKMEPRLESVDVNEVVEQTVEFVGNVARINNVKIQTELDPHIPVIACDQAKLQQVFLNIINNAIEATGENGLVQITTRLKDSHIVIDIADNGPGISREMRNKIFDPFFSTKKQEKGSGLGLWICFNILEHMGGTISVDSEEGKGAIFTIRLAAGRQSNDQIS